MTVFICEHNWEAMLSCIYDAWSSRLGHQNIRLTTLAPEQYSLLDEYVTVTFDRGKAESVMDAINMKISSEVYSDIAFAAMSSEEDALDVIYRVLILGFAYGPNVLKMVGYKDVSRFFDIRRAVSNEVHHFIEFVRFHEIRNSLYVAHIEPKNHIVGALGGHFSDRMPSENWMIVDDVHKEAIVQPRDEDFYLKQLSDEEFSRLLLTEEENDGFTDLWKVFFDSIAVKERLNPKLQRNLFPLWKRKHAVEFNMEKPAK